MKKRILIFTDAFSGGGAEEVMNFYGNHLLSDYEVLHLAKWNGPKDYELPPWKIDLNKKSSKECISLLKHHIREFKPNLILTSTGHNNIIILFLKLFYFRNIKVIIRESSIASVMNKYTLKSRLINKFLVKPLYRKSDRIIAQSKDMYDDLIQKYKIKADRVVVISNPIIGSPSDKLQIEESKDKSLIKLINIGRFSKEKGHERLLYIFKDLPTHFTLYLLGDGILMDEMKDLAKDLGVFDRVHFCGFLQEDEKVKILNSSDVYIQTSFVEGFPNSLLQAVSMGLPAIAYNVLGGTKEIINDNNGFLIEDGNDKLMIEKLRTTDWLNKFNREVIIADICSQFSSESIIQKLKELIKNEIK